MAIQSPLATLNDYKFTEPVNTNFIQGRILGPNPPSCGPVRGEDSIYLFEAFSEMNAILSSQPSTSITNLPGIDTIYMRITYPSILSRPAYYDLYELLDSNTNGNRDVLLLSGTNVTMPTNLITYRTIDLTPYHIAGNAAVYSHAAATATVGIVALGKYPRVKYLAATNVAAFYDALKRVSGIAKDFYPEDGTNIHTYSSSVKYDTATLVDGSFVYDTIEKSIDYSMTGGGLIESSVQEAGRKRVYDSPSYYISRPIYSSTFSSVVYDDELEVPLFSTSVVRSSQITFRQGWTISRGYYSRYAVKYVSPTNIETIASVDTNFVAMSPISTISISETTNGLVIAKVIPNYVDAYNAFFNGTSYPYPDDISYPQAPSSQQAFGPTETGTRYNYDDRAISIRQHSVGLILDISWHTGFNQN